ncbi:glutathione hydrolase 1 proenzyme-like isoform X3 [Hermetia illucens]|nr:glutathione hydrolase 1 proenzyme-like isoform X3 [Hermetia illucens]
MSDRNSGNGQIDGEVPLKNMARVNQGQENELNEDPENGMVKDNRRNDKKICSYTRWMRFGGFILALILIGFFFTYLVTKYLEISDYSKSSLRLIPPNPEVEAPPSRSILYVFQHGAICSDNDICSEIGQYIFNRGGNVMDSALATLFCNGITTMQSLGIGGGFIMNVFIKAENRSYTIDARETAPKSATDSMFTVHHVGTPTSVGVPGEVLGYWEAHKRFGSMTWKEIIEPSIKVCEDGFPLSKHMLDSLHTNKRLKTDPLLSSAFINKETGDFYQVGARVHPPKELCSTYRLLALHGAHDFYNGTISKLLVDDLKDAGSLVTAEDLASYSVDWHDSIPVNLDDNIMYVVPPAGGGTLLALIMNTLRGYNFTSDSISTVNNTILTYHRAIEAFKFAFAKRSLLGDMRFNNLTEVLQNLTSPDYAEALRQKINDSRTYADFKHYGAKFYRKSDTGTSHLSVVAPNGDAVSATSSINFYFGCGVAGKRTGIIFNNGLDDFSYPNVRQNFFGLPSSKPNFLQPGKRAMSSMSPTIITDTKGNVKLVIGSAGGTKITTAVAMVIMRVLWFDQDIKQAIDAPRIHHQLVPNEIEYEFGNLQQIIGGLEEKGHRTSRYRERGSTMCGITKNETAVYANADFRKKGGVYGL